jgi:hypothetical protein
MHACHCAQSVSLLLEGAITNQLKAVAIMFLLGVISFGLAYLFLTVLPLAVLGFVEKSDKTYTNFADLMKAFAKSDKQDNRAYWILISCSVLSFVLFMIGCLLALGIVWSL